MASKPTSNGDGQPIPDDYVSPYVTFGHFPMEVDLKDIKLKPARGYPTKDDPEGVPCTATHGVLLNAVDGHDVGDNVIVGGGQTKLRQKIEKGVALGKIRDGIFLRIVHDRMIGQMKNFEVIPNPKDLVNGSAQTVSDDSPAPF